MVIKLTTWAAVSMSPCRENEERAKDWKWMHTTGFLLYVTTITWFAFESSCKKQPHHRQQPWYFTSITQKTSSSRKTKTKSQSWWEIALWTILFPIFFKISSLSYTLAALSSSCQTFIVNVREQKYELLRGNIEAVKTNYATLKLKIRIPLKKMSLPINMKLPRLKLKKTLPIFRKYKKLVTRRQNW